MTSQETVDSDGLRQKYREERDKRLTVDHRADYVFVEGDVAERFVRDPWAKTDGAREPVVREVEAIIAGGGFGGIIAGANIQKAGFAGSDICIIDRGADFGGTWYWNRYPGLSCDTESYCYLPLLEETGYIPKEKYSKGPEIFEHCQRIGRHFGLYEQALLQTEVTSAVWDEAALRWIVKTDRGDEIRGRFLWMCGGAIDRMKLPGIPGLADFKGTSFHTMRWNYDYTGGGPEGNMTKLRDKRVGLIGTGATAIQAVPQLGDWAKEFYVFQRTPSAVNVRGNRPTDPEWAKDLPTGWQMDRMENFLNIIAGTRQDSDMVDDAWTENYKMMLDIYEENLDRLPTKDAKELGDFRRMEQIRARVDEIVTNPETAAGLKAWYGINCKRPTFHDGYLKTFNLPNVTLVDTKGRGIERITERGIIANGKEYELDCIVFATGFDAQAGMLKNMGLDPVGEGGVKLTERWTKAFTTLHGMHVSGFPNMFVIAGPQGTIATSFTYGLKVQTEQCARIMAYCRDHGLKREEVTEAAEAAWQEHFTGSLLDHKEYFQNCTPGYYNFEGQGTPILDFFYGPGPVAYRRELLSWMDGRLADDLEMR